MSASEKDSPYVFKSRYLTSFYRQRLDLHVYSTYFNTYVYDGAFGLAANKTNQTESYWNVWCKAT